MILVVFELTPASGQDKTYFDLAQALSSALESTEGFISVERFESVTTPGRYVSLSVWRDEAAVQSWRNQTAHRMAQGQGRQSVLTSYRLRVAQVIRDYGVSDRTQAPPDSCAYHDC